MDDLREQALSGKVVAITGAARGIGLVIARHFAVKGARVAIIDRDAESGHAAVQKLQESAYSAEFIYADIGKPGIPESVVDRIVTKHGQIDVLINNARARGIRNLLQETVETWDESLAVGLRAAFFASQHAIRRMGDHGGGSIVNIGSIAGFMATHESPAYHVVKAGLIQLTRYLAVAGGPMGVRINCVCPGFVVQDEHAARFESPENSTYRADAQSIHPLGRVGSSDDVAEMVVFLSSPAASFVNGQIVVLDGGATLVEQFGLLQMSRQGIEKGL